MQISIIQDAFGPNKYEVETAKELLGEVAKKESEGIGSFEFKGKMVDRPVFVQAERILKRRASIVAKEEELKLLEPEREKETEKLKDKRVKKKAAMKKVELAKEEESIEDKSEGTPTT